MPVQISFERSDLLSVGRWSSSDGRSRTKVTELERRGRGLEDILDLEIAMEEGWTKVVHCSNTFTHVDGYL